MRSKRLFPFALTLLLAIGVQATEGAPLRALAELRATKCCADVCHHGRPTKGAARHCCQVAQDDPGVLVSAVPPLVAPALAAAFLDRSPAVLGEPSWCSVADPAPQARAAPLYLLTRSLRL